MNKELTLQDLEFILESLKYSKKAFEDYEKYSSYEFKEQRIHEINQLMSKVKSLKKNIF